MLRTGQQLVLAGCFPDPQEVRIVERAHVQPLTHLLSDHEEADTRMMLHAVDCSQLHQRVVVQSPDTDVAVLAIHVSRSLSCDQI